MTTLTRREAVAVADALTLWRRRMRTPELLTPGEIDRLVERCLTESHQRRWEYVQLCNVLGDVDLTNYGRVGWEITAVAAAGGRCGDVVYLRRELIEEEI
jgi:hypothetical protein